MTEVVMVELSVISTKGSGFWLLLLLLLLLVLLLVVETPLLLLSMDEELFTGNINGGCEDGGGEVEQDNEDDWSTLSWPAAQIRQLSLIRLLKRCCC